MPDQGMPTAFRGSELAAHSDESTLPRLLDTRAISEELGVKRAVAEAIIRRCPKQEIPGCKRLFVRRSDVERLLAENLKEA
ncbi:MAG: hypothetical protein V4529_17290 [Gemmatimonadota bacterium]